MSRRIVGLTVDSGMNMNVYEPMTLVTLHCVYRVIMLATLASYRIVLACYGTRSDELLWSNNEPDQWYRSAGVKRTRSLWQIYVDGCVGRDGSYGIIDTGCAEDAAFTHTSQQIC